MSKPVTIRIKGPWAEVSGLSMEVLHGTLSALDPNRHRIRSYQEERWDGRVALYDGNRFPAGLTHRVVKFLKEIKREVRILDPDRPEIDLSKFNRHYVKGITLREHQFEAGVEALKNLRGAIKSPTGSGKSLLAYVIARYFYDLYGWRSLVMTPRRGLVRQTARMFRQYANHDLPIGEQGDGKKTVGPITVGTPNTLGQYRGQMRRGRMVPADKKIRRMLEKVQVYIADEAHLSSGNIWNDVGMACTNALVRIAMSGTLLTYKRLKDMRMIGLTGPIIYRCKAQRLIDEGLASKPKIAVIMSDRASGPPLQKVPVVFHNATTGKSFRTYTSPPYQDKKSKTGKIITKGSYRLGIIENPRHNQTLLECVQWMVDHKRQTLLLCRMRDHWKILRDMLQTSGLKYLAIWGATDTANRDYAKERFAKRRINVLLASTILDLGEDLPAVEAIVLAEGIKTNTSAIQRVGRGMRLEEGGATDLWVVDVVSTTANVHIRHGMKRCEFYEREGYEVRAVTKWPSKKHFVERYEKLLPFESWN
jgi:superfamily II DNA or RNA helicase